MGGLLIILQLIFAETGLLLGLVIPGGETLVFTAGLLISAGALHASVAAAVAAMTVAAIAGDTSGYLIGRRLGKRVFNKHETWYFKKKYMHMADNFLTRHRSKSLIRGKFLPVVRPFMPLMMGVTGQGRTNFLLLSFTTSVCYISLV